MISVNIFELVWYPISIVTFSIMTLMSVKNTFICVYFALITPFSLRTFVGDASKVLENFQMIAQL